MSMLFDPLRDWLLAFGTIGLLIWIVLKILAIAVPVILQDERLSSREAESRLALRESDWRKRKAKLDAAAAAVILQDYLDERPRDRARRDDGPA